MDYAFFSLEFIPVPPSPPETKRVFKGRILERATQQNICIPFISLLVCINGNQTSICLTNNEEQNVLKPLRPYLIGYLMGFASKILSLPSFYLVLFFEHVQLQKSLLQYVHFSGETFYSF